MSTKSGQVQNDAKDMPADVTPPQTKSIWRAGAWIFSHTFKKRFALAFQRKDGKIIAIAALVFLIISSIGFRVISALPRFAEAADRYGDSGSSGLGPVVAILLGFLTSSLLVAGIAFFQVSPKAGGLPDGLTLPAAFKPFFVVSGLGIVEGVSIAASRSGSTEYAIVSIAFLSALTLITSLILRVVRR